MDGETPDEVRGHPEHPDAGDAPREPHLGTFPLQTLLRLLRSAPSHVRTHSASSPGLAPHWAPLTHDKQILEGSSVKPLSPVTSTPGPARLRHVSSWEMTTKHGSPPLRFSGLSHPCDLIYLCLSSTFDQGIMPTSKGIKYQTHVKDLAQYLAHDSWHLLRDNY